MKLALLGYGRMGREVERVAVERGHEIAGILDAPTDPADKSAPRSLPADVDMIVDFSTAEAVFSHVRMAAEARVGIVIGTTGWERDRERVEELARESEIGLLHAPNFSLGVLVFTRLVNATARILNRLDEYDVHLSESHHRHKVDHPGGTACNLADLLVRELDRKDTWTTELIPGRPVDPRALQVAVHRVGEVPGIHEVGVEGPDDQIRLRHEARGRGGFARGAVRAAEWLHGRTGVHTMADLIEDLLD